MWINEVLYVCVYTYMNEKKTDSKIDKKNLN